MCTVPAVYGQRESEPRSSDLRKLTERGGLRGSVHADDHVMQLHRSAVRMHSAGLFVRGIDQPARRIEQTRDRFDRRRRVLRVSMVTIVLVSTVLVIVKVPDDQEGAARGHPGGRSEEHTSELQSRGHLVCRLLLAKKNSI